MATSTPVERDSRPYAGHLDDPDDPPAPTAPTAPTNRWLVLGIVALAQFLVVLDLTIVNVALPSISDGLGFAPVDLQWVVNAYALVFGGFLLLGGRAADLLGRRRVFVAGLLLFSAASLLNGLATSPGVLIAGRALQGLGGALLSPAALATITTIFSDERERTRALGVWSAIAAGGGAVGLLLGGVLTQAFSWEWVFLAVVPVALAAAAAAMRFVPESRGGERRHGFDVAGAVSVTAGLVLVVYAAVEAQRAGWTAGRTLGLFAAGFFLLGMFLVIEQRHRAPLMRLGILRIRTVATGNAAMMLAGSGLISMFFFASLYAQDVLGYGPMRAGLAFLPMTAGVMTGVAVAQQLSSRLPVRVLARLGLAVGALGMLSLLRLAVHSSYPDLLLGLLLVSTGLGLAFVPLTLLATSGVDPEDAGLASGLFNTAQQIGGALGLAALATLAADRTGEELAGAAGGAGVGGAGVGAGAGATQTAEAAQAVLHAQVSGFHVAFAGAVVLFAAAIGVLAVFLRRTHLPAGSGGPPPVTVAA